MSTGQQKSKTGKAFPHFWKSVNHILRRYNCNCKGRHTCELRNCWTTPPSYIALLQKHFLLSRRDPSLIWNSKYQEDQAFGGAKHDFFKQDLSGKNTYINPPFNISI